MPSRGRIPLTQTLLHQPFAFGYRLRPVSKRAISYLSLFADQQEPSETTDKAIRLSGLPLSSRRSFTRDFEWCPEGRIGIGGHRGVCEISELGAPQRLGTAEVGIIAQEIEGRGGESGRRVTRNRTM